MPARPQQRDSHGCFLRSVQPQQEVPDLTTPVPQPIQPNAIQRLYLAFQTPLVSDIPASEFISNIAQALHLSLPIPNTSESPPSLPLVSDSPPFSPIRYVPPPCYATNPPIPILDLDMPGSDDILLPAPLPSELNILRQPTHLSDDKSSPFSDKLFPRLPPPLPPRPYQAPPQPPRQHLRARPQPQP